MSERLCCTCPVLAPSREPRYVERGNSCESCRLHLADLLAEIPGLVAQTTDKIHPEKVSGEKVSGSRELPAPVNLTALGVTQPLYVRGPRSAGSLNFGKKPDGGEPDDQIGVPNPEASLDQWVMMWAEERREHLPSPDIHAIVGWLLNRLDWACDEFLPVDDFAFELKSLVRKLRGIVQEVEKGTFFGLCPRKLRDGTRCNRRLYVDVYLTDLIKCPRPGGCGAEWNRRNGEWVTFRDEQDGWNEGEAA